MKTRNREMEAGVYVGTSSGSHIIIRRRPYSTPFSDRKYVVEYTTKDKAAIGFEIEVGDKGIDTVEVEPLKTGYIECGFYRHQVEVMSVGNAVVVRPDKESMSAFIASSGALDLNNLFVISQKKILIGNKIIIYFGSDGDLKTPRVKDPKNTFDLSAHVRD